MAESKRFLGKVTVVTGGSRGIGKACVKLFAQHGSNVVFCANDEDEGKQTEKELQEETGNNEITFVYGNVTQDDDVKRVISTAIEKYKRIDCLINNAGTHPPHATIDDISSEQFNSLININLTGYFRFCKFTLPALRKVQGCIINIASLVAELGDYHGVEYSASKGGIVSMTKALAVDEAEHRVRVNSVSPGNIRTPLLDYMCSLEPDPEKALKDCDNTQILGNIGEGRDIAMACLYLAADAPFVTGTNLNVSGGAEVGFGNKSEPCV